MARRKNPAAFEKSRREREKKKKRQEKLDRKLSKTGDEPEPDEPVDGLFPEEMLSEEEASSEDDEASDAEGEGRPHEN